MTSFSSCADKCDPNAGVKIGEQFFTVTYLDPAGGNYLTNGAWNLQDVVVRVDTTGGKSALGFKTLPQTFADGKLGPFYFTKNFLSPIDNQPNLNKLLAKTFTYDYYIKKGAVNQEDAFRVEFRLSADDCNLFWNILKYYKRDNSTNKFVEITEFSQNQKPEMVFIQ
ncbi:MAG: hypothetical protein K1X92_06155 [Bacteroidia bacterium]|nr:hypothetical protein [Bacteroidia bacterium]